MSAKLFITGMRDPVELSTEEGKAAEALIADTTKPRDAVFSIQGVWTGKKSDMRYVTFQKEDRPSAASTYDKEEAEARHQLLKQTPEVRARNLGMFKTTVFMRSGMKVREPNEIAMAEAYRAALAYFIEHPDHPVCPLKVFAPIIKKHYPTAEESLADKMRVKRK